MSLNYNLSKCTNLPTIEDSTPEQEERTTSLIFRTMAIGLGSITEKNAGEVYVRNLIFTKLYGGLEFTPEEIRRHIGMHTNATDETRTQWVKRITEDRAMECLYEFNK